MKASNRKHLVRVKALNRSYNHIYNIYNIYIYTLYVKVISRHEGYTPGLGFDISRVHVI